MEPTFSTLSEKYKAIEESLEEDRFSHQKVICKHVGIKNPQGGYFVNPRTDENGLPQLNVFLKKNMREVQMQGWELYEPASAPKAKKSTKSTKSDK